MESDIDEMALEMSINTATGKWLDLWGDYFGIPRKPQEKDEIYSKRMIAEIIEPKATLQALQRATARWLNYTYDKDYSDRDINVFEPWHNLLVTSQRGEISYLGRLPDNSYWCHGVVDISIPDSSELSLDLIMYLNEIKACGVKIAWTTVISWDVLTELFESSNIGLEVDRYLDIFIPRENDIADGFRTLSEYIEQDECYNTPISVRGNLSGSAELFLELILERDFEPFVMIGTEFKDSPIISVESLSEIYKTSDLTVGQLLEAETSVVQQIPNKMYQGKRFEDELHKYSEKNISDITEELKDRTVGSLSTKVLSSMIAEYNEDKIGRENFIKDWNKNDYLFADVSKNSLTSYSGPMEILTE